MFYVQLELSKSKLCRNRAFQSFKFLVLILDLSEKMPQILVLAKFILSVSHLFWHHDSNYIYSDSPYRGSYVCVWRSYTFSSTAGFASYSF